MQVSAPQVVPKTDAREPSTVPGDVAPRHETQDLKLLSSAPCRCLGLRALGWPGSRGEGMAVLYPGTFSLSPAERKQWCGGQEDLMGLPQRPGAWLDMGDLWVL